MDIDHDDDPNHDNVTDRQFDGQGTAQPCKLLAVTYFLQSVYPLLQQPVLCPKSLQKKERKKKGYEHVISWCVVSNKFIMIPK